VNPAGIRVNAGRPAVAPAPRSVTAAVEGRAETTGPAEAGAAPATENPLSQIRPRPRPTDLSETNEKAQLGGRTRAELATLRPRQRPSTVVAVAEAAAAAPDADTPPPELAAGTRLAVARSLEPKRRPAEIVAVASAARVAPIQPDPAPSPQAEDNSIAEADNEPVVEVASAAAVSPNIPTKAGVARTATVKNAINLSQINLIGVYGSSSQRRALVRLSSGKYVKVKVGDRVDGGRVAAIGEAELVYTKGGRQVKLAMPKT
jgi:hypothetical protein